MIVGPGDTPYHDGCYEFDMALPPDYPKRPPLVQLITTGRGAVRFNANMYSNGKVCLSLLGTHSGGMPWNPKESTLLQVTTQEASALELISERCVAASGCDFDCILHYDWERGELDARTQALIWPPKVSGHPWFNEPGYAEPGTPESELDELQKALSACYNREIRRCSIQYCMINQVCDFSC